MKKIVFANKTGKFVFLMMASLSLTGCCMIGANYRDDEEIGRDRLQTIKCGKTTREDIVTQLGPPIAIARKGKSTMYSAPRRATVRFVDRSSAPFLELFSKDRALRDDEVVYYYRATERNDTSFLLILLLINIGGSGNEVQTEHLWLLVDEKSGIIEDVVYRDRDRNRAGCTYDSALEQGK